MGDDFRSRMQVVFTIKSGSGADHDLGWLDIRSHPLGLPSDAIRVTMYNHQTEETVRVVREFMHNFHKRHSLTHVGSQPNQDLFPGSAAASAPTMKFGKA